MLTKHAIVDGLVADYHALVAESKAMLNSQEQSTTFRVGVKNQAGGTIEILIYGVIGDPWEELDARSIAERLGQNETAPVLVRIDSPGGLAFEGLTIHNALIAHKGDVTTRIEGLAGSAGAIIAVAGDTVEMVDNGTFFIHRAMGVGVGNARVMTDLAEFLDKLDQQIAKTFAAKTGKPAENMMALMTGKVDGTTMDASEAADLGFVDNIIPIRGEEGEETNQAADASTGSVPANPPNGEGEGQPGRWRMPTLADFTDKSWAELSNRELDAIARHYAWEHHGLGGGGFQFCHHFPPSHKYAGLPSEQGVAAALRGLDSALGGEDGIEAHLRAHLPAEDRAREAADLVRAALAPEAEERLRARQRLLEVEAGMP